MTTGNALTHYAEGKVGDAILANTAFTPPATLYVALFTAAPTDAGGGSECSGAAYARTAAGTFTKVSGGSSDATVYSNSSAIVFPTATANYAAPVVAFGLFDASTGGNLWLKGSLASAMTVSSGSPPTIAAGALTFTFD